MLPYGSNLILIIWGDLVVSNNTMIRFAVLHFLLPFVLIFFIVIHINIVHLNITNINYYSDKFFNLRGIFYSFQTFVDKFKRNNPFASKKLRIMLGALLLRLFFLLIKELKKGKEEGEKPNKKIKRNKKVKSEKNEK